MRVLKIVAVIALLPVALIVIVSLGLSFWLMIELILAGAA
jgi:hypothetical protein